MLKFTILQKLLIVSTIGILLSVSYVVFGYATTKINSKQIDDIKHTILPISLLQNDNQRLLEDLVLTFSDAAVTAEKDMLVSARLKKEKILTNLNKIKSFDKTIDIQIQIRILNKYYDLAQSLTLKLINNEEVDDQKIIQLQTLTQNISMVFLIEKDTYLKRLTKSLNVLSKHNTNFFNISIIGSFIGLILMLIIVFYFYFNMRNRFARVITSAKDIATEEPDFSKKIELDDEKDEVSTIIKWFNILQLKLEKDYNELNMLKIKAEDVAKIKSEFLANMSHEIRTPIHGIIGLNHLALQTNLNNKQKNYLKKVDNLSNILLKIINDILDFSKLESGKLELDKVHFNIYELVDDIVSMIELKLEEKELTIDIEYSDDIYAFYYGDSLKVSQILINLLTNAVKFTNKGEIKLSIQKISDNKLKFEVKDQGIGITKDQQARLFQSFNQADNSITRKYGGTGLGLAICKGLVELMDGKIWVESEYTKGSSFIFEIELIESNEDETTIATDYTESKNILMNLKENRNILLAEDNLINQEIILGLLQDTNITIDMANDGEEAVDKFRKNEYDLIFMDLQMPKLDGIEATKIIRKVDKDIPIVALTADSKSKIFEEISSVGISEYISKPIELNKFYSLIVEYLVKNIEK